VNRLNQLSVVVERQVIVFASPWISFANPIFGTPVRLFLELLGCYRFSNATGVVRWFAV